MLTDKFRFAFRTLRCFGDTGANVHILGSKGSKGLRFSRYCKSFHERVNGYKSDLDGLIGEINALIDKLGIDIVVCGEHYMMRPLIAMAPKLDAPCFPMPSLEQFDLLNNKWRFTQLCETLGIRVPPSQIVADVASLRENIRSGQIELPLVVKPLDFDGSVGVVIVQKVADLSRLDAINYAPMIVQKFIDGVDISASMYCERGKVRALVAFEYYRGTFIVRDLPHVARELEKIAAETQISGVINFDTRLTPSGSIYWLECNPRFFMSMFMAMIAGVSFVELGLPNPKKTTAPFAKPGTKVLFFKGLAELSLRPWKLRPRDLSYALYVLKDPVPWLRETLGIDTA